jgi:DNA-binding NtrC family response regulator
MTARSASDLGFAAPIIGNSLLIVHLRRNVARAAQFSSNVLISGPSGTGKELVARWLHQQGPRAGRPFIPVDCASLSGELMVSQLLGHVVGAFTGAHCDTLGCFRAADKGTLFLDEIGELDLLLQAKLLRVLQERTVTPVGSLASYAVDVRVVAATNRDLRREVAAGRFREDLDYRLSVIPLRTAPLRERREDVPLLAAAFLDQLAAEGLPRCTLSADAVRVLALHDWPGNVRQLRNILEQAVIETEAAELGSTLLADLLAEEAIADAFDGEPGGPPTEEFAADAPPAAGRALRLDASCACCPSLLPLRERATRNKPPRDPPAGRQEWPGRSVVGRIALVG